uniref:Uncharacterized protein n=1 Tax=Arundo donax TaxID=35708 RepID=A0A0A9G5N1_ARUDO
MMARLNAMSADTSPPMAGAAEHCRNTTPHCKARNTVRKLGAAQAQRLVIPKWRRYQITTSTGEHAQIPACRGEWPRIHGSMVPLLASAPLTTTCG